MWQKCSAEVDAWRKALWLTTKLTKNIEIYYIWNHISQDRYGNPPYEANSQLLHHQYSVADNLPRIAVVSGSTVTRALPDDKAAMLRELDKAISRFTEKELRNYRDRIWHL